MNQLTHVTVAEDNFEVREAAYREFLSKCPDSQLGSELPGDAADGFVSEKNFSTDIPTKHDIDVFLPME